MYNLRYHLASLAGVFLALAVGLLLGTVVVERGALDRQRTSIVQSLQSNYDDLKAENDELRRESQRSGAFAKDVAPLLVADMLRGRTVVVITNGGRNDGLSATRDAVRAAGGDVVVATFRTKGLGMDDEATRRTLSELATPSAQTPGVGDPVVGALAAEWERGGAQPITDALRASGELSLEGADGSVRADAAVLLASFDDKADPMLIALVAALDRAGRPAVGAESQRVSTGVAQASLDAGLSSVDAVDRPEGALSLAYVLAGKAEGHFGVKDEAAALYPKLR